jgi:uncharacterized protein YneF (UPF0154 family)
MIQLNKNFFSSQPENKENNKINLGREIIEDMPIFTMKSDLATLNKPDLKNYQNKQVAEQTQTKTKIPEIPQKQSSSPFLNQNLPAEVKIKETKPTEKLKKEANWEKLILISIVCFLLLAFGAGGYYYWISKEEDQKKEAIELPPPPKEEIITFSIENPNYLPIDTENSDGTKIKETIKKYVSKVADSGSLTPVEFVITDLKNDPINFSLFTSKMGINFSQDLISSLNTEAKFSLFIYNDNQKTRLGLAVDSNDDYSLKKAIFQEEASLVKDVEPLFLDVPYDSEVKNFSSSSYDNTEIRYNNLSPFGELTVDYAIFKNKLVIGTTKLTIRSIMDQIKNNPPINNSGDSLNVSNTVPNAD